MSFPRYPKYKASGVEWLGDVPEHWSRSALKRLADYENGFPYKPEDRGNSGRPIIRISQLTTDDPPAYFEGAVDGHVPIEDGDLLFSWSASIDAFIWQRGPALLNQHIFKVTPSEGVYKRYLFHLIRHVAPKLADFDAHGSTMRHIKKESLGEVTYLPPLAEQRAIALFLDRETKKIDELVAAQERLIELLKAKRQAVISHAVTKGLDPAAPMKPSGVEWLGDVPAHWRVLPLRWASRCCSGDGLSREQVVPLEDEQHIVPVFGGNGFMGYTQRGNAERSVLAVGRVGALCGNIHTLSPPAWITDNALILTPDPNTYDLNFLSSVLRARNLNEIASRTAQPLITGTQVGDQRIPTPTLDEQNGIMHFLNRELAKFDAIIAESAAGIALLTERRSALISAAVTGQIDVRNAVPEVSA